MVDQTTYVQSTCAHLMQGLRSKALMCLGVPVQKTESKSFYWTEMVKGLRSLAFQTREERQPLLWS